ncbi:carbohydrate deacetylase isoform X2 [Stegostoma tigrinum]|uniref:carbohydrate deacetylase isoform X2 n=1 Tax=Stegostoma tigrinum TaxID=3053191 RepID=UPI00202B2241|nr:carbohydrate deacetylase isoform X2 [Stegostoma tigrinum]
MVPHGGGNLSRSCPQYGCVLQYVFALASWCDISGKGRNILLAALNWQDVFKGAQRKVPTIWDFLAEVNHDKVPVPNRSHSNRASRLVFWSEQVDQELRGQVDLFCELTGHLPHHMDGHQHVHVLPGIRDIFAQVLSDYGIKYTRVPIEPGLRDCDWIGQQLMDFYLQVEKDAFNSIDVFKQHGIRWADIYIGLTTMGKNMSVSNIQRVIENAIATRADTSCGKRFQPLQDDTILTMELMVHPGYSSFPEEGGCGEGPDEFSMSADRFLELQTLKESKLLKYYEDKNIQLCSFKDIKEIGSEKIIQREGDEHRLEAFSD